MEERDDRVYQFDSFRLEPGERRLLRGGKSIRLSTKVFDLLVTLVRNRGHLVDKQELLGKLWPDSFVEESSLTVAVANLRKALGESPGNRYIETLPKLGYRFVAAVRVLSNPGALPASESPVRIQSEELARMDELPSIAVLPLANGSGDPQMGYLCDGITETLINSLSRLSNLRVMARSTVFHYRGPDVDPREVGYALGVATVLVGTVGWMNEQLSIRVELVDVRHGWQLWGEQFRRAPADLLALQSEITRVISERLRVKLLEGEWLRLTKWHTENVAAYHSYLKGRYCWNKRTTEYFRKGISYFNRAIELDPKYALAYTGLADSYILLSSYGALPPQKAISTARAAVKSALELDNQLAEGHASLGFIRLTHNWDLRGAAAELRWAIRLNANYATAHHWYANCLSLMKLPEQALSERRVALGLDPLSPVLHTSVASQHIFARQYAEAAQECREALELDPYFYVAHAYLATAYALEGDFRAAKEAARESYAISTEPEALSLLGYVCAAAGQMEEARSALDELLAMAQHRYVDPFFHGLLMVGLGETDNAFAWLGKAYKRRSSCLIWLGLDPRMDPLRADQRFEDLLRRIGLGPVEV